MIEAKKNNTFEEIDEVKHVEVFESDNQAIFKSDGENLKNYRIYGNTVDGESVGDKTENLFDGTIKQGSRDVHDGTDNPTVVTRVITSNVNVTANSMYTLSTISIKTTLVTIGYYDSDNRPAGKIGEYWQSTPCTFTIPENGKVYFIFKNSEGSIIVPTDISSIMLNSGSTALPYEPYGYRVPVTINNVTTNLYLPEPLKMVGDEAEYVDFEEQKQHRVRKNLIDAKNLSFYRNNDQKTTAQVDVSNIRIKSDIFPLTNKYSSIVVSGIPSMLGLATVRYYDSDLQQITNGLSVEIPQNTSYASLLFKDDTGSITDETKTLLQNSKLQVEYGNTPTTYEPYISDVDLDIALPALPTVIGTNLLNVNTNIKPSKVWGRMSDPIDILYVKDNLGNILFSKYHEIEDEPPITYKTKKTGMLLDYRIYGQTVDGESVGDLVTSGEHAGEYKVPVTVSNGTDTLTTPIYLPEQIKKVGDEAECIDYREQKMHRVRKNLFPVNATSKTINGITFTVNTDNSVTCNGTNNGTSTLIFEFNPSGVSLEIGESCIVTGCPEGGKMSGGYTIQYYNGSSWGYEIGHGATFTASGTGIVRPRILISREVTVDNLTFYPMVRKADVEDDTYEPYIENTDLDVILPALPTIAGTNTLSVGTEVQPSEVYIKGKIKKIN